MSPLVPFSTSSDRALFRSDTTGGLAAQEACTLQLATLAALALLGAAVGQAPCPNGCSSHGVCFNGTCTCEAMWKTDPGIAGYRRRE